MGERVNGIHEVGGSIPPGSTSLRARPDTELGIASGEGCQAVITYRSEASEGCRKRSFFK
jgi:hypothetical protein